MPTNWVLGEKFHQKYPHLKSVEALWKTKWEFPAQRSLYPFHDGKFEDFEPIFKTLIEKNINDGYSDEWTREFIPTAEVLTQKAASLESSEPKAAAELYQRASVVYRISRFPFICSSLKIEVFEKQIEVYLRGASLWETPITAVTIKHTYAIDGEGSEIPLFVRIPQGASSNNPAPAVLLITGLDGHRPDNTVRSDEFLRRGWASVIVDIPGIPGSPAAKQDANSPDRLWSSIFQWMQGQGHFDMKNIAAWGLSAGGYYAVRIAHTHKDKLVGSVAQGAGSHHYLGREWLEQADNHEYPFRLLPAYTLKYGYTSEEELLEKAQKTFSLVETGIVNLPATRLLLVNGTHDGLMPIEDSMLLFEHSTPKEARFYTGLLHMGYPPANSSVYPWLEQVIGTTRMTTTTAS